MPSADSLTPHMLHPVGVRILYGRWQDVLSQLGQYDGIFFDTYGEYYEEMHEFHQQLPRILKSGGVYSFFNGLASDNIFFHLVYGRLIQVFWLYKIRVCWLNKIRLDPQALKRRSSRGIRASAGACLDTSVELKSQRHHPF